MAAASALQGCRAARSGEPRRTVRFGMATDCHYADIPDAKRVWPVGDAAYRQSLAKFAEFVETMNREKPDFAIELGDFKDAGEDRAATLANLEKIEAVFARFGGERYHVAGNHDFDRISPADFLARTPNGGKVSPSCHYSFEKGGVKFVVLDACYDSKARHYDRGGDWTDANVPREQLDWLEAELASAAGAAVVFCHQCLAGNVHRLHIVKNAKDVRAVLEKSGKVKAVFTGHMHSGAIDRIGGVTYYSLRALVMNSGPEENAYALADVFADGSMRITGFRKAANTFIE